MKNKFATLLLVMGLLPLLSFAQFVVTPDGLRNEKDLDKEYIVIDFEGKSASELYAATKQYIVTMMTNPDEAIKADIKDAHLRYALYTPEIFSFSKMLVKLVVDADFEIDMKFKDGRIRYEIVGLNMQFKEGTNTFEFKRSKLDGWAFYDNQDKLYMKNEKQKTEDFFNSLVKELTTYILNEYNQNNTQEDNW